MVAVVDPVCSAFDDDDAAMTGRSGCAAAPDPRAREAPGDSLAIGALSCGRRVRLAVVVVDLTLLLSTFDGSDDEAACTAGSGSLA